MIRAVTLSKDKKLLGKASYKMLELDSKILGFTTAKIVSIESDSKSKRILIKKLIKSFINDKIKYVTFRIKAKELATINILEEEGFRLVDEYLILVKQILSKEQEKFAVKIREATLADSERLQNDLGSIFTSSRFFNDPLISKDAAVKMHKVWINNCIKGKAAEKVYVAEVEEICVGFIALEREGKEGHIPLIGVNPEHRGKKIAQQLTLYAINNWFIKKGVKTVQIETQLTNIPAVRTYENLGFRLVDSAVTLRWTQRI